VPGSDLDWEELERRAKQDDRSIVTPPAPFESWFEVDVALELRRKGFEVTPQFEVAGKRIDLVVEGGQSRLAVECDGDRWHGAEQYEADMERQRKLERCGWEFFRIKECVFYADKAAVLEDLWRILEEKGIYPVARFAKALSIKPHDDADAKICDSEETCKNDGNCASGSGMREDVSACVLQRSTHRVEDVGTTEIQHAIVAALSRCPNQSCTIHSLTSRVLKELGILTRGNPRRAFERRVMHALTALENQGVVEKYRAKNERVRLLKHVSSG